MTLRLAVLFGGLFVVPGLLLWLAHGLRHRTGRGRSVFWGAVVGHGLGVLVMVSAALWPPVLWGGETVRIIGVHGSLAGGAVLGGVLGLAHWASRRSDS